MLMKAKQLGIMYWKYFPNCLIIAMLAVATVVCGVILTLPPVFAETASPKNFRANSTAPANRNSHIKNSHALFQFQNLLKEDYRRIADQLYYQAIQDYERWLKLGLPSDFHNALFHIKSSIDINQNSSEHLFFQGMLYASLKADQLSLAQATDSFLSALDLQPDHLQARFALAQTLQEQGKFQLAAWQYQLLLDAHPEMVTGLVLAPLAFCYLAGDISEDGLNYLRSLSLKHSRSAHLITTIAVLLKNNGRDSEAAKEIERVIGGQIGSRADQEYAIQLKVRWLKEGTP